MNKAAKRAIKILEQQIEIDERVKDGSDGCDLTAKLIRTSCNNRQSLHTTAIKMIKRSQKNSCASARADLDAARALVDLLYGIVQEECDGGSSGP